MHKRAGRQYRQASEGLRVEVGGGIEARFLKWIARINFHAKGARFSHKSDSGLEQLDGDDSDDDSDRLEAIELGQVENALREFRRTYTMHEVAEYYAAMSDEELGIKPEEIVGDDPDDGSEAA